MDEVKVEGGGNGKVCIDNNGVDTGDGMQCSEHPNRYNPAGGICAFCLQEKLGKLVSSSSCPLPLRGSPSSSSSPSFKPSDHIATSTTTTTTTTTATTDVGLINKGIGNNSLSLAMRPTSGKVRNDFGYNNHFEEYPQRKGSIPFFLTKKKKMMLASSLASSDVGIAFQRSKSTSTARRTTSNYCTTSAGGRCQDFSPRGRGGFWPFPYFSSSFSSSSSKPSATTHTKKVDKVSSLKASTLSRIAGKKNVVLEDDNSSSANSQEATASVSSFERKVSRSRSIGCGSRSFSGDFFERISTGFGDCTLRRVESQREGKTKASNIKERVRCGGIFGGLFTITPSSSSSTSSSYWASSSKDDGKTMARPLAHGRSRSWGWAFASPMKAFGKPAGSRDGRRENIIREASDKNTTPNLAAIPSLLAVRV